MGARTEYLARLAGEESLIPALYAVAAVLAVSVFVGALIVVVKRHKSTIDEAARLPLD